MEKRFSYLFDQFASKRATDSEQDEFFSLLNDDAYDALLQLMMEEFYEQEAEVAIDESADIWFLPGADQRMLSFIFKSKSDKAKSVMRLWPRVAAIAAMVAVIVSGIYFFNYNNNKKDAQATVAVNDFAPGKIGATLILANGKKICLTDAHTGELAEEAGISITKTADGQVVYEIKGSGDGSDKINTLTTAKGETYILTLPDKSKIWMNAASSLTYSAALNERGQRRVKLSGEAYFEVSKDKRHPFVVESNGQQVEVLGTHFNINAYPDETVIATTLLEGSVKLTAGSSNQLLKPGEQGLNNDGTIRVKQANIDAVIDWKNEEFFLDKMDFRVAMRKIARWYDIEVVYSGSVPDNLEAGGWIPRNSKLSDVLKSIESTGQVHFKIEGRKLYVSK